MTSASLRYSKIWIFSLKRNFITNIKEKKATVCMIQILEYLFRQCLRRIKLTVWCYSIVSYCL